MNRMQNEPHPPSQQGFKRRQPGNFHGQPQRGGPRDFGGRGRGFDGRGFDGRGSASRGHFPNGRGFGRGRVPPPPGWMDGGRGFMRGRGPMMSRGPPIMNNFRGRGLSGRGPPFPPRFGPPRVGFRGPPPPPPPRGPMRPMRGGPLPMIDGPNAMLPPGNGPGFHQRPPPRPNVLPQPPRPGQGHPPQSSGNPHMQYTHHPQSITTNVVHSYSQEQVDKSWTEHIAPNSAKYYHNSITKESTFLKPKALGGENSATAGVTVESSWKEYKDATTGKSYYSNGVTTTWEKPAEFESKKGADEKGDEPPKKKKKSQKKRTQFGSKVEALAAFRGLLLAKGVQPTTKWNEVSKLCSSDSRWEACEILSLGERKQALAEYQTKRANELRSLERQERMRAKDAFSQMLGEIVPSLERFNAHTSRFSDFRDNLVNDDRFYAVEDEETREAMFHEFCEEMRKREERKRRNRKREAKESFFSFLKEFEEKGGLTFATTWSSFVTSLSEEQRKDTRFHVSGAMSESDRELYFSDFVLDLQTAEDEKRRRIRDARRRAEKAQRDAYRETLRHFAMNGSLLPSSRWRNVEDAIRSEATFAPVKEQDSEAPRVLFEDFMDEWNEIYRRDRSFMSRLVHPSGKKGLSITKDSNYDDFCKALLDEAAHSAEMYSDIRHIINHEDPVSSARVYFDELLNHEKSNIVDRAFAAESSEDEGEIIEDGEITDDGPTSQ